MKRVQLHDLLVLSDSGVWGDEDAENGVSVLRSTNFNSDGSLNLKKLSFRAIDPKKRDAKLLSEGDILLEKSGGGPQQPVGRVCLFQGSELPQSFGNFIARLRPTVEVLSEYLFYYLRQFHALGKTSHYQKQTTGIRNLEFKRYLTIEIPVPSIAEQQRIVDILSRAEGIVRLRREAKKKAAELIPTLFLDMFGDPATNPKGWPACPIAELCAVQTGGTPSRENPAYYEGEIPWVKTGEVVGNIILNTEEHISAQALTETNCKKFPVGTILVAMYGQGQTRGRCAVLGVEASTNQACAAILPSDRIAGEFLFRHLQIQYEHLRSLAQGGNQANLNLSMIKNYSVILPPKAIQNKFAERVSEVRSIQSQQSVASATAQATFDALLSKVFSN